MKKVTRNIDLESALDLLQKGARACLSFAQDGEPLAQPVALIWQDQRYLVGFSESAIRRPGPGQEVVLLVDEGVHFYDLRAIYIRGHIQPVETPVGGPAGQAWFEVLPAKTVAWDYGKLREEPDER